MRPVHPNDMANQVVLMKRVRDAIANSIPVARSVVQRMSDTEPNVSVTSVSVRRPWESEGDFSFAR
jgi:hypothetical protein